MKIMIYARPETRYDAGELSSLLSVLDASGINYTMNDTFAGIAGKMTEHPVPASHRYDASRVVKGDADFVVSYGGDGTFLECVKMIGLCGIPVLGINSGRLGFLANIPKDGVAEALEELKRGKYRVTASTLLEAGGDFPGCGPGNFAFNEFSIQRGGPGMVSVETYINGEMVATYRGDGVILSTPAGSTAYSLSVGGPIVDPRCDCLVLAPIAPHNLSMRPVVLPDGSDVEFRIGSRGQKVLAGLDGNSCPVGDGAVLTVKKAEKSVFLVRLQNISFYDTLRNKMLWGFDRRDDQA